MILNSLLEKNFSKQFSKLDSITEYAAEADALTESGSIGEIILLYQ